MGEKRAKASSASVEAAERLQERLTSLDEITTRRMFGGVGAFASWKMFALVDSNGVIFFKVSDANRARYEAVGAEQHSRMPYYQVPAEVLGDDQVFADWAQASIAIAKQAK